ncbi:MAG TPA: ATP-binding protein [Syntrophorhabdales bacterium]|nr:ATP-binding protein [Syntrophorhabdales bacterium]
MKRNKLSPESVLFQWNFYERTIANYSIIMKIFQYVEDRESLIGYMPKVFVEETDFDMCQIIRNGRDEPQEGFFTIDDSLKSLSLQEIERLNRALFSPCLLNNVSGYGTIYIYPLLQDVDTFGYLLLGKKDAIQLDEHILREFELLCQVLNKSLLLNISIDRLKALDDLRLRDLDSKLVLTKTVVNSVIDQFPEVLLLVDRSGRVCFANKKARTEFDEQKALLVGEKIENLISGIDSDSFEKDLLLHGTIQYRIGDQFRLFELESYPIKDDTGAVVFKSIVLKDVMDEKLIEEENIHRSKMESIGKLAGGVAHDYNNLLTGMLGYASLMKKFVKEDKQLSRYVDVIEGSARRAAKLTEHLLNFSRRQKRSTGIVDVNVIVDDVLFLVSESFRDLEVVKTLDPLLPPIKGDEGELQHALLNLCVNARDAMPNAGKLTVRTERKKHVGNKDFILIEIEDSGTGMDQDTRRKIFEPFFTTKENGTKLGMGLYLVDRFVKSCGGFIELESEPGQGTRFRIYLPMETGKAEVSQVEPEISPAGQDGTVLVVEDEETIRELVGGILKREGLKVLEAPDGHKALELLQHPPRPIDLVILDMVMPKLKGEGVLKRLKELGIDVKVVVSSGFMNEGQREKLKAWGINAFLDKPYREEDVLSLVRKMLPHEAKSMAGKKAPTLPTA